MLDIFTHIIPGAYLDEMAKISPRVENLGKRLRGVRPLHDLDQRFRGMDEIGGEYRQIISLPNPSIEEIASGAAAERLAKVGNDAMAELCARHPDRFPGFVAAISLDDVEKALSEIDRAVGKMGAKGIQVFTNIAGHPLDEPRFAPVFAAMARHDLPIWLHPARTADMPDYSSEKKSRYEMWWCFGWPYETSVAVTRLVFSGLFDRHPNLKIITHHAGGMIPFYEGRIGPGLAVLGSRTTDEDYSRVLPSLKRPHLDYFRDIYADTAMFGGRSGLKAALDFFGPDHIVFASDTPLAPIPETIEAVKALRLAPGDLAKVMSENAKRLLKL
jgi:uncharacterized protein